MPDGISGRTRVTVPGLFEIGEDEVGALLWYAERLEGLLRGATVPSVPRAVTELRALSFVTPPIANVPQTLVDGPRAQVAAVELGAQLKLALIRGDRRFADLPLFLAAFELARALDTHHQFDAVVAAVLGGASTHAPYRHLLPSVLLRALHTCPGRVVLLVDDNLASTDAVGRGKVLALLKSFGVERQATETFARSVIDWPEPVDGRPLSGHASRSHDSAFPCSVIALSWTAPEREAARRYLESLRPELEDAVSAQVFGGSGIALQGMSAPDLPAVGATEDIERLVRGVLDEQFATGYRTYNPARHHRDGCPLFDWIVTILRNTAERWARPRRRALAGIATRAASVTELDALLSRVDACKVLGRYLRRANGLFFRGRRGAPFPSDLLALIDLPRAALELEGVPDDVVEGLVAALRTLRQAAEERPPALQVAAVAASASVGDMVPLDLLIARLRDPALDLETRRQLLQMLRQVGASR
jgi:hypothetical protein